MATSTAQRVGIWVITGALVLGTLGGFLAMILVPRNQAADQAEITRISNEYQKEYEVYNQRMQAQADELSTRYYDEFSPYQSRVSSFNKDEVAELATEDLKIGETGEALTEESTFTAYYLGWTPDGNVFDGSIEGEKLTSPITVQPGMVISGWTEGVVGMKVGGVRELTIPADKAYGDQGSGDTIPANTPLKFVIMIIESPEVIEQPQIPQELLDAYQ
ncbi:hypothetical protein FJZ39_00650 [Candidatus Saccharibacteria bacterium]|nr:hypothetical protein [Candidatus Saccharibacteria bacterium]